MGLADAAGSDGSPVLASHFRQQSSVVLHPHSIPMHGIRLGRGVLGAGIEASQPQ